MDEKALDIIERSSSLFMRLGIRSVSMDDIARELGISKKTIYKYFKDKNDLVINILRVKIEIDHKTCSCKRIESENAIDEMFQIIEFIIQTISKINPSTFFELQKYHPEAWALLDEHRWTFVRDMIRSNLERGIEEGLYRPEINIEVISRLYVGSTNLIIEGKVFPYPEFRIEELMLEVVRFQIRGISNSKGLEYLTNKLNKSNI